MRGSKSCFSIALFILCLFSFTIHLIAANDLVHQTCKKCSQNDPNINYRFCVASLGTDPRSHCANLCDLGNISIDLLRRNVTKTRTHIKELLKNKKLQPWMRSCLLDCLQLYSEAVVTTRQALRDYKAEHYDDANIDLSSVLDAPVTCEDGFREKKALVSPLAKMNNHTFQLSAISLSIINMLR